MARSGVVSWPRRLEKMNGFDLSGSDSDGVHVLAVDDSLIDRKLIEALLKSSSCKVTAVDSGRRALQFLGLDEEQSSDGLDGLKVDMIITDYCMPGMTGYELLKKIKESSTFREIPVVIMSSENVLARIDRCLEEGAEDFIMKPVKLTDVKRLKNYMSRVVGVGNKRKLQDTCDGDDDDRHHSLSSSPPSNSSSPLSSPSDSSPSSNSTPPSSPTTAALESPVRRLKMTSCDQIFSP